MDACRAMDRLENFVEAHNKRYHCGLTIDDYDFVDETEIDPDDSEKRHYKSCVMRDKNNELCVRVALPHSFFDEKAMEISEYDFVRTALAISHETWHYKQSTAQMAIGNFAQELRSCITRQNNQRVYERDYAHFTYEIAAERHAINSVYEILGEQYDKHAFEFDKEIVKYANARTIIDEDENGKEPAEFSEYFIDQKDCISISSIKRAFDRAYSESFNHIKHFDQYDTGELADIMNNHKGIRNKFVNVKNGRDELHLASETMNKYSDDIDVKNMMRAVKRGEIFSVFTDPLVRIRDAVCDKLNKIRNPDEDIRFNEIKSEQSIDYDITR